MNTSDVALYVGQLLTAWVLGFTGGYTITKWRDAMRAVA